MFVLHYYLVFVVLFFFVNHVLDKVVNMPSSIILSHNFIRHSVSLSFSCEQWNQTTLILFTLSPLTRQTLLFWQSVKFCSYHYHWSVIIIIIYYSLTLRGRIVSCYELFSLVFLIPYFLLLFMSALLPPFILIIHSLKDCLQNFEPYQGWK